MAADLSNGNLNRHASIEEGNLSWSYLYTKNYGYYGYTRTAERKRELVTTSESSLINFLILSDQF